MRAEGSGPYNVLFLCTGNSARSTMAEAILNRIGSPRFRAYSAGSHPKGVVHPEALRLLSELGYDISGLHSKSWSEFTQGTTFDHIVTVCSSVAAEACPVFPRTPATIHWEVPNPAAIQGTQREIEAAFRQSYDMLSERIGAFVRQ